MEKKFKVAERIILLGILEPYYPAECLSYAFDIPKEEIQTILDYYHKGAARALADAVWIMIHEQGLSGDDVREILSSQSKIGVEYAIKQAIEGEEEPLPETGDTEVYSEAFKAGYAFLSALLFHNLKVQTRASIEEINALFSMSPAMDDWVGKFSHINDKLDLKRKLCGKGSIEEVYEALTDLVGPEVTARLKKYEATAEVNRTIRALPRDIGIKLANIINDIAVPLSQGGASPEVFEEIVIQAIVDAGILPESMSAEQFRQRINHPDNADAE